MTIPPLHPFPEVARMLGIPLRTLRKRSWAREFEHIRIGRERYLTDDQLQALIESLTVTTARADDLAQTQERVASARSRRGRRSKATPPQAQQAA